MNDQEFTLYCQRRNLPEVSRKYIAMVRSSPPSRRVQSGGGNVVSRFASRKMGVVVQSESHRHELAVIFQLEHDDDVLAFYEQPESIQLKYQSATGRPVCTWSTPDFFVIKRDSILWIDVKPEDRLRGLAERQPNRYRKNEQGEWCCPPGEKVAALYGFGYVVWSSAKTNPTLVRNLRFLDDYTRARPGALLSCETERLMEVVKAHPGITFGEIRLQYGAESIDAVFAMVATKALYVDLTRFALHEREDTPIYTHRATAEAFASIRGASTGNETGPSNDQHNQESATNPQNTNPKVFELIRSTTPAELQIANRRARILREEKGAAGERTPERTLRRWHSQFRRAEATFGEDYGYLGLIPNLKERGNRQPRIRRAVHEIAGSVIQEHFLRPKRVSKWHTYGIFLKDCETAGIQAPSYKWLRKQIHRIRNEEITRAREGKRAAYKHQIKTGNLSGNDTHGDYPWQIVHVDHTEIDLETVDEETGQNLGRPWLSLMFDAFSRTVLAFYLTFDPPSARSVMMLFRDCVRRHSRLPSNLVVDGGKEFGSYFFETFTAMYEITVHKRPPAQARFGSVIEREFGTLNTQFFHNLAGNTQNTKNPRQLTKSVNPKTLAVWSLERVNELLSCFCFEVYASRPHPALRKSPAETFSKGLNSSGARPMRTIKNDETFQLLTMPSTPKGTSKVQPGLGVKIFYMYFWNEAMRDPQWEGKQVSVRYDPENLGTAFALLGKTWVPCISAHNSAFNGRSEKQLRIAVEEIKRSRSKLEKQRFLSAKELATFFESIHGEEVLRLQRRKDLAVRRSSPARRIEERTLPVAPLPKQIDSSVASLEPETAEVFADY